MLDRKPPKVAQETPKSFQRSPKRPPRGPKRSPRDFRNASKTILKDNKSILQKSMNVLTKIKVFEVRRVILGVQNRPQEAPREDKQQLRRTLNKKMQQEGQQLGPKSRLIDPVDVLQPPEGGPGSYTNAWAGPGRTPGHARARVYRYLYSIVRSLERDSRRR